MQSTLDALNSSFKQNMIVFKYNQCYTHSSRLEERKYPLKDNTQAKSLKQPQLYDTTLKALFGDEATQIIPYLLPGAELLGEPSDEERNIEIDRSTLKADLVYRIRYKGELVILNPELQTDVDTDMEYRLLEYHAGLRAKHKLPVLSAIIYPFKYSVQQPPYEEKCGDELFLAFHPKVICLWQLDAEPVVKNHIMCLYTLLPAMKGARAVLLLQALEEMVRHYSRRQLGEYLSRFYIIMRRAKTMSDEDKRVVEEELFVQYRYDEFLKDNPAIQKLITEGKTEGKIEGIRDAVLRIVNIRFSDPLIGLAKQALSHIQDIDTLYQLEDVAIKSDEQGVRAFLTRHLPSQ